MKYTTKITYKIYDPDQRKHPDPEAQALIDRIHNDMLSAFTDKIQKLVIKYNKILRGCHIEFILDLGASWENGFQPNINIIYIPEYKEKLVKLILKLIRNSKEEDLIIKRQKNLIKKINMEKFKLYCFEHLEGKKYEKGELNDLVMDLINAGIEYYKNLDQSKSEEFNSIERKLNDTKIKLGEYPINYGSKFKSFYSDHFTI